MDLEVYLSGCYKSHPALASYVNPWEITNQLQEIIALMIKKISRDDFHIMGNIAVHKNAEVEDNVTLKEFTIVENNARIKSGTYLRRGVYVGKNVQIGPNCEVKQSYIFQNTRIAHLNYVGNSIIGEDVNIEAGAIIANHFNERADKSITVIIEGKKHPTNTTKFGSLVGDHSRIGANAVLNPGTILPQGAVVNRLTHVDQLKDI